MRTAAKAAQSVGSCVATITPANVPARTHSAAADIPPQTRPSRGTLPRILHAPVPGRFSDGPAAARQGQGAYHQASACRDAAAWSAAAADICHDRGASSWERSGHPARWKSRNSDLLGRHIRPVSSGTHAPAAAGEATVRFTPRKRRTRRCNCSCAYARALNAVGAPGPPPSLGIALVKPLGRRRLPAALALARSPAGPAHAVHVPCRHAAGASPPAPTASLPRLEPQT